MLVFSWSLLPPAADEAAVATEANAQALPRDIALDLSTGELDLSMGGLYLVRGPQAVAQSLYIRLGFFLGEHFMDASRGTPWLERVFVKAPRIELVRAALRDRILGTTDVVACPTLTLDYDSAARRLSSTFIADSVFGPISTELEVTP
jgi:hypothetical protein